MPDRFIGLRLKDRYEIQEFLGSGGMALVFKAHDENMDRPVAVKFVKPEDALNSEIRDTFINEARLVAQVEHLHILSIYDQGIQAIDGQRLVYLVIQLACGSTLADRLKEGALALDEAERILKQVCDALDYAHREGVLHLDLKPANILFDQHGHALVADFGLAKLLREASRVKADTGRGTPPYMPPEQFLGTDAGSFSDVYALGITLYQMLTGKAPEREPSPPFAPRLEQSVSSGILSVIKRATQSEPEQRYRTAGELAQAFTEALQVKLPPPPSEEPIGAPPVEEGLSPWRSRLRRIWVLLALLVFVAGLVLIGSRFLSVGGAFVPTLAAFTVSPSPSLSPTLTPAATVTTTFTPSPSPSSTPTQMATATPTPTLSPFPSPTNTPSLTPTPLPTPFIMVSLDGARIYTGPGENYDVLDGVRRGDQLPLRGRSEDGAWLQVYYFGNEGWIRVQPDPRIDLTLLPVIQAPPTPTAIPTKSGGETPTPLRPNTLLSLQNPDFERVGDYGIPGWTLAPEDNYNGEDYDPNTSFDTPFLKQADNRAINGPTLQMDGTTNVKFKVHVFQVVAVPPSTTVRFQASAGAFSDGGDIKLAAGVDPDGDKNCSRAHWGDPWMINQEDGVVQVVSPDVVVGPAGRVTICLYAESLSPASHHAAYFDSAMLIGNPR